MSNYQDGPEYGQRGFSIVEALVAFIVLAVGLLALLSFHNTSQRRQADAKVRTEAVALAEQKLNELASFVAAGDPRLSPLNTGACPGADTTSSVSGVATFAFTCDISGANPREVSVTVAWRDR